MERYQTPLGILGNNSSGRNEVSQGQLEAYDKLNESVEFLRYLLHSVDDASKFKIKKDISIFLGYYLIWRNKLDSQRKAA